MNLRLTASGTLTCQLFNQMERLDTVVIKDEINIFISVEGVISSGVLGAVVPLMVVPPMVSITYLNGCLVSIMVVSPALT